MKGLILKMLELTVVAGIYQLKKRLLLPVCGSPALAADGGTAERQRQSALGHKTCCWENRWLTGIAGVFCTGKEREKEREASRAEQHTLCQF